MAAFKITAQASERLNARLFSEIQGRWGRILALRPRQAAGLITKLEKDLATLAGASTAFVCSTLSEAYAIALRTLPISPGSVVAVPGFGGEAAALAVLWAGHRPKFMDVSLETGMLTPALLRSQLTDDVQALILSEPFGGRDFLPEIAALCGQRGIHLIEDARNGFGLAHFGSPVEWTVFGLDEASLCPGMGNEAVLVTNDKQHAAQGAEIISGASILRDFAAQTPSLGRVSPYAATLIDAKLGFISHCRALRDNFASWYTTALSAWTKAGRITLLRAGKENLWPAFPCRIHGTRDELVAVLRSSGIEVLIPNGPMRSHPVFRPFLKDPLPNAEKIGAELVYLPLHSELSPQEFEFILAKLTEWLRANSRIAVATSATQPSIKLS